MKSTIHSINKSITNLIGRGNILMHDVAEAVIIRESEDKILPAIVCEDGECDVNLFDDRFDVGLYHKLNGITYNHLAGWGDESQLKSVHDMSLIVYGKRDFISPYHMEKIIGEAIGGASVGNVDCTTISADFNRLQVFATEFSGYPFFLQPNVFLFKINYRITINQERC